MLFRSLSDLDRASEVTLQKAAAGKISPSEAHDICALIENHRRVLLGNRDARSNEPSGPNAGPDQTKPKRFSGSMEELLAIYRDLTLKNDVPGDDEA